MSKRHGRCKGNAGGFSLIELLVVVAIIGILVGMYLAVFSKVLVKAHKVEAVSAGHQTNIARLADNANIARPGPTKGADRDTCRKAYHQTVETSSGPIVGTELRYHVTNDAEFRAYWHTLINPAASGALEFNKDGSLVARDETGTVYNLEPIDDNGWSAMNKLGTFPVMWEYLSTNMGEMNNNETGINVLFNDGHIAYMRYGEGFPASPTVATLSRRFLAG